MAELLIDKEDRSQSLNKEEREKMKSPATRKGRNMMMRIEENKASPSALIPYYNRERKNNTSNIIANAENSSLNSRNANTLLSN